VDIIFSPWRYEYVSAGAGGDDCVFCRIIASTQDQENLVIRRAEHNLVVLNRYPYTTGHLMIAPLRHLADPCEATPEELNEMTALSGEALRILRQVFNPEGFNLGMNIGRVAGAGVERHFHMHVVPRWGGDTSFVTLTGGARIIPQSLDDSYKLLKAPFEELRGGKR
jgi:ATP adenylyltransferase